MRKNQGFILLAVSLSLSLLGVLAYLLNRENGLQASRDARAADTDRARYAAEAGLQALNARIQTADCNTGGVSTTVSNASFAGASYTATSTFTPVSGNIVNPGTLVSTGTFNGTSVTLTRNSVYAYKNSIKTYTFQPNAASAQDTYLASGNSANFGSSDLMPISSSNSALLKFNLVSIFPAGAIPETSRQSGGSPNDVSTLSLRLDGFGAVFTASAYRMNSAWTEAGANWFTSDGVTAWTAGGAFHPGVLGTGAGVSGASMTVDLTQTTLAWMTGRYPNHGVRVATGSSFLGALNMSLSNTSTASSRPKMDFNYLQPCGTSGPG